MTVDPATAAASHVHDGKTYYFCCKGCLQKFQADPKKYLSGESPAERHTPLSPQSSVLGTEYTCPMHPEVVSDHPGSCPKCGMALEPRTVAAEEGPNPEYVDMRRRFWIGLALSIPILIIATSDMLPGKPLHAYMRWLNWAQL